jgi:hypothetical protein
MGAEEDVPYRSRPIRALVSWAFVVERVRRIELALSAWESVPFTA